MRIAAGVLIIIVAIINLIAGFGYALGGGLVAGAGAAVGAGNQQLVKTGEIDAKKGQAVQKEATTAQTAGSLIALFGFFLLAMCGLGIAAGVVLFMEKAAAFALVIGILQLIAEGIGCVLLKSVGVTNIIGIVAGILVIVAALSYRGKSKAPVMA